MRLIDADALLQRAVPHGWSTPKWVSDIAIDDAPTIDAVPVVRCKDCKYYEQTDDDYEGEQGEDSWGVCRNTGAGMMRCGYCSYGERKDDV